MRMLSLVSAALLFAASTLVAHADSVVFDSQSGDSFNYGIDVTSSGLVFDAGQTITFTGLADVTGAFADPPFQFFDVTFTSTSVTFTNESGIGTTFTFLGPRIDNDVFTIDSTAPLGSITYTAETDNEGILTGSLEGPAAVTPEPSTLALFGTGILGLAGVARRKLLNA
jgi:hypothetical protein